MEFYHYFTDPPNEKIIYEFISRVCVCIQVYCLVNIIQQINLLVLYTTGRDFRN